MGQGAAKLRVVRGDHRIIAGKAKGGAIGFGRVAVPTQVPAEHLITASIDHADEIVWLNGGTSGHYGRGALGLRRFGVRSKPTQSPVDVGDQRGHVPGGNLIAADVGRDNVGGENQQG